MLGTCTCEQKYQTDIQRPVQYGYHISERRCIRFQWARAIGAGIHTLRNETHCLGMVRSGQAGLLLVAEIRNSKCVFLPLPACHHHWRLCRKRVWILIEEIERRKESYCGSDCLT